MGDPNEPRRMTPRGDGARKPEFRDASGNAGRDGFTVVARREPPGGGAGAGDSPFSIYSRPSDCIDPPVGQRDYGRGPRFSEDY